MRSKNTVGTAQLILLFLAVFAFAGVECANAQQLNEHCVVSILNRNAQVRPDGSWELPNIPSGFGPVRARATCVENGITRSGQSDFFTIVPGRMNAIPPIILGPTTPIPQTLAVTAGAPTLFHAADTTQLTVMATFAGGSAQDVTAASKGTTYLTTNPAIATVSANGLVTAVRSGTVLIRAANEGTAGLVSIRISFGGDSDGDGIPDDVELILGLNPNNPTDALEDFDHDGLSNVQEYQLGTDLRNPDTDGDGISDGEEVVPGADGFITNPLLRDTDGDGVPDGVEIATGSDPTNPASLNLARALSRFEVTPAAFVLTVNAIIGQAFQQLTVTGHLIDGTTTIDLTSTLRGTNYASSNLNICNFGAPDGRVFAGSNGPCTITVTNSGFSAQAQGTVTSFTPTPLSFVSIPGFANNVDVSGNFAYVAAGSTGLQVVNVTNRAAPVIVASLDTPGNANDVQVVGNLAFVADGASGLRIINIANPLAPTVVGSLDTPGDAWDVVVRDNKAYVADGASGLQIIDVSNPASPRLLGLVDPPGTQKGVDVDPVRQIAVLASGTSGIHVVDVSNPANPTLAGSVSTNGDARDVVLKGNFAFVADFSRSLTSVDVTDPRNPFLRNSTPSNTGGLLQDVAVVGDFSLGADVLFVNGVPIADISDPVNPIPRAILNFSNFRDDNGTGIAADAAFVYLTAERGISENGVSGDTRLYSGQYLALEDRGGVSPTVQITAPAPGSTFIEGSSIPVRVNATDDVAVLAVNFLVNGQAVFTDTTFPYEFTTTAPIGASSLTLGATAVDLGSNVGSASTVQVNVIPDPLTTVIGRVVDANAQPVDGAAVTVFTTFTSTTGSDGTFAISNVPTVLGNIVVQATATVNGQQIRGSSGSFAPVVGGTTDVGQIVARFGRKVAVFGAPSTASWNTDVQTKLQSTGQFTQVDAFLVTGGQPIPTLAQLQQYDAVLVYSDTSFNNGTAIGDVLADYMDGGGGVVLATFAYWSSGGLSIQGRIKTAGYLPFTTASQSQPGNLTLVPILPQHPILNGVTSFNGGTSSYHNSQIAVTAGSTLIANWSNGQPLIATKTPTTGRIVGLNFYPPSSTVRGDFWVFSTNGALILANALTFAAP